MTDPAQEETSTDPSWTWRAPALIVLIWLAYGSTFFLKGLPSPDEGYVFQHAREWLSGKVMYRDIVPHIPPLSILVQAAWIQLLEPSLWVGRLHFLLIHGLILGLTCQCLVCILPPRWSMVATLPAVGICSALLPAFAWYNFDATVLFLVGALIHLRFTCRGRSGAGMAGVAFGLSFLAKTNYGVLGAGLVFAFTALRTRTGAVRFMTGFAAVVVPFCVWVLTASDAASFFALVVRGNTADKGGLWISLNLILPLFWTISDESWIPILCFSLGVGLIFLHRDPILASMGLISVALGMACLAPTRWRPAIPVVMLLYPLQVLFFFVLGGKVVYHRIRGELRLPRGFADLAGIALVLLATDSLSQPVPRIQNACAYLSLPVLLGHLWALQEAGLIPRRRWQLAGCAVALLCVGIHARASNPYFELPLSEQTRPLATTGFRGISTSPGYGEEVDSLLERVRVGTRSDPAGGFLAYPEGPAFYVGLGKLSPTRLLNVARTFTGETVEFFERRELERLMAHPPLFILLVKSYNIKQPPQRLSRRFLLDINRFKHINQWISSEYVIVEDRHHLCLMQSRAAHPTSRPEDLKR